MAFFCGEIRVLNDDDKLLYAGPSFVRCEQQECRKLVTSGYLAKHGYCYCGGRRFRDALQLTQQEEQDLRNGNYVLSDWETFFVSDELKRESTTSKSDDRDTRL